MAHIYPQKEDLSEAPYSEMCVYNALSELSDNFFIFHSVQWIKRSNKRKSTWKENDFLILNKSLGALVLEVKGGDIVVHGGVFRQINTATKEVNVLDPERKNDPLSQAIDGVYHYRELIRSIQIRLDERFPIEAAVWFSTSNIKSKIKNFPLKYREAHGAVLGNEDFEKGEMAIYDIFNFYRSREKTDITDEEFHQIIELIASDFELITAPTARKGELDYAFLKITNEQVGLLDYISEQKNATIQGVAGTGKTLIAKEAARRFGADGRKVLFLCFNRFLYLDLQYRYPYDNVTYLNIHTLISQYSSECNELSTSSQRASALQKIDWELLDFDDVIIDEAQDFDNDEIIYFKELVELKGGHFLAFFDKNQLLTTKNVPNWIVDSECRLLLTKNCRNTYEIAKSAYNVIDVELNQKTIIKGERTSISFVKGEPITRLAKLLKLFTGDKYGYEYSDIVILSLKKEQNSIINNVSKISGIPISRDTRDNNSIFFTTSIKFKGLESRVIIVVDIDASCFIDERKKRNFYVACSRASQHLALFVSCDDDTVKQMAQAISIGGRYNDKGKIAMKTQSNILDLDSTEQLTL